MPVNSKRKGKDGELSTVHFLRSLGFHDAARSQQYNGLGTGDVIAPDTLPNVHIEVKYGYPIGSLDLGNTRFNGAMLQASRDCKGKQPCVLWRPKKYRDWRLTFRKGDLDCVVTVSGDEAVGKSLRWLNELTSGD